MKISIRIPLAFMIAAASLPVFADNFESVGTITEIHVDSYDNRIKIFGTVDPPCAGNHLWWSATRTQSKDWLALALAAYTTGKKVEGWVGNSCEVNIVRIKD